MVLQPALCLVQGLDNHEQEQIYSYSHPNQGREWATGIEACGSEATKNAWGWHQTFGYDDQYLDPNPQKIQEIEESESEEQQEQQVSMRGGELMDTNPDQDPENNNGKMELDPKTPAPLHQGWVNDPTPDDGEEDTMDLDGPNVVILGPNTEKMDINEEDVDMDREEDDEEQQEQKTVIVTIEQASSVSISHRQH